MHSVGCMGQFQFVSPQPKGDQPQPLCGVCGFEEGLVADALASPAQQDVHIPGYRKRRSGPRWSSPQQDAGGAVVTSSAPSSRQRGGILCQRLRLLSAGAHRPAIPLRRMPPSTMRLTAATAPRRQLRDGGTHYRGLGQLYLPMGDLAVRGADDIAAARHAHDAGRACRQAGGVQYERNEIGFSRGMFRIRGDVAEISPPATRRRRGWSFRR